MICKLCSTRYQGNMCPECGLFSYERAIAPTLNFGRHNGLTIEQVYEQNPGYLNWMLERKAGTPAQRAKARLLLKIPPILEPDSTNQIPNPKPETDDSEVDIAFLLASTEKYIHNRNTSPANSTQADLNLGQPYPQSNNLNNIADANRNSGFSQPYQNNQRSRPVAGHRPMYSERNSGLDNRAESLAPEVSDLPKGKPLWTWLIVFIFRLIFALVLLLVVIAGVTIVSNIIQKSGLSLSPSELSRRGELTNEANGCAIKGNVSIDSGEKIYHVPGQRYYANTKIESRFGERWFCSEADAVSNGWRKSRE